MNENNEYINPFIIIPPVQDAVLLKAALTSEVIIKACARALPAITTQSRTVTAETLRLAQLMSDQGKTLTTDNTSQTTTEVNKDDLNASLVLQKKADEIQLIRAVTENMMHKASKAHNAIQVEEPRRTQDSLLKQLMICRAEFYLLKARYVSLQLQRWKDQHSNTDIRRFTPEQQQVILNEACHQKYFDEYGISIAQNNQKALISDDLVQDAKYELDMVKAKADSNKLFPPREEVRDAIALYIIDKNFYTESLSAIAENVPSQAPDQGYQGSSGYGSR